MQEMAQAIAAQAGKYICLCSGARGEFFCIECEQYFCQTCRISHKKANVSKSHKLVEALEKESKDCEMCLTKYAGQYFCVDCSQYFCSHCKMIHLRANVSKHHAFRDSSDLEKTETSNYGTQLVQTGKKKTNVEKNKKDSFEKDNDMMTVKLIRQKCHDELLRDITDTEKAHLKDIEGNHPVKITIDQVNCEIILDGVLDEVVNAKLEVYDALRKFAHTRFRNEEATLIKEQVQWFFIGDLNEFGLPMLIEYPDKINMYLEYAHNGESGRKEVEFKNDQGEEYIIVIKDMRAYLKKDRTVKVDVLRREKVKGDGGYYAPPPGWDYQGPNNVRLVTLLKTSPEYKSVEQKFINSVFRRRSEWANQLNKQTFKVTKIERVQNLSLYHTYAAKKSQMEKQNPPGTNNEKELWHSAFDPSVVDINVFGFNRSYCQDNNCYKDASWGDGVNFADDASYSASAWLSRPSARSDHNMFLCKVLTGVSCKGQRCMRVLPIRQDGSMFKYDSAIANRSTPVVEYVIFNDSQAYPQYYIRFVY